MAKKIEFAAGSNLESVVYELMAARARGESVYGVFNGHELYSDTVTMDSAYMEVIGCTKEEYDKRIDEWRKNYDKEEEERKQREVEYKKMVEESRTPGEKVTISTSNVVDGLKFIAENQGIDQTSLVQGLIDLGCNFTLDEVKEQFPNSGLLFDGMKKGELSSGATVIANVRDSEFGRSYSEDRFLSVDDDTSIYHFVRIVTEDPSYTKENIDALSGKKAHKM